MKSLVFALVLTLLVSGCATMDVQRVTTCSYEGGNHTCVESQPLVSGKEAINWGILAVILGAILGVAANQ